MFARKIKTAAAATAALFALPGVANATAGLNGAYYAFSSTPTSVANAQSKMAGTTPTATFLATSICYTGGSNCSSGSEDDANTLNAWLGTNATNISANSVTNLANHAVDLTGYINIVTGGSHSFSLYSDDGANLYIDGALVVNNDGDHGPQSVSSNYTLTAGMHSIEIIQYEHGGGTTLSAFMDGTTLSQSILSTTSAVPEPATWGLMILGFGLAGAALRRNRDAVSARA